MHTVPYSIIQTLTTAYVKVQVRNPLFSILPCMQKVFFGKPTDHMDFVFRFSDFLVNELKPDGTEVHLTDTKLPPPEGELGI